MNKDLIKYLGIGAAVYFAWPYLQKWLGGTAAAPATTAPAGVQPVPATTSVAAPVDTDAAAARVSDAERLRVQNLIQQQLQAAAQRTPISAPAVGNVVAAIVDQAPWLSPSTAGAIGDAYSRALTAARAMVQAATDDKIAAAAAAGGTDAIAEAVRRGLKYDYHQWNWFRSQTGGTQPDPGLFTADAAAVVGVTTYLAARVAHGLSGLGELGFINPILHWVT